MKYLIIGAGPAGLTFANRLLDKGEKDFLYVDGARHVESMHVVPDAYAEKLDALIGKAFS